MNARVTALVTLFLIGTALVGGEPTTAPFSEFEKAIKSDKREWRVVRPRLSKMFNAERKRLGKDFEKELLKFIDADIERHGWWVFLVDPECLGTNPPQPYLALLIMEQRIALYEKRQGLDNQATLVGESVMTAIFSKRLGFDHLAAVHKARARRLVAQNRILEGAWPILDKKSRKVYESIKIKEPTSRTKPSGKK